MHDLIVFIRIENMFRNGGLEDRELLKAKTSQSDLICQSRPAQITQFIPFCLKNMNPQNVKT